MDENSNASVPGEVLYEKPSVWNPLEEYNEDFIQSSDSVGETISLIRAEALEILNFYDFQPTANSKTIVVDGMEVGDDRVDIANNPDILAVCLSVQSTVVKMKTSPEDTFITKDIWNFCEITNTLPANPEQSFDTARKTSDFDNLGFIDVPPLRIVIDVSKGDGSHSSSEVGKAAMLGTRSTTPRTEQRGLLNLASYIQDGCLRTSHSSEPKYLPYCLGGSNCPSLFNCADNLHLSVKSYRGGGYDRIYGSATNEVRQALNTMDGGCIVTCPLAKRLRDKREYLFGTYDEKILLAPASLYRERLGLDAIPLYEAAGANPVILTTENRLLRARVVMQESEAIRENELSKKIKNLLFFSNGRDTSAEKAWERSQSVSRRKAFGGALNSNSAFKHLLDRQANPEDVSTLLRESFRSVKSGQREFTLEDSAWIDRGGRSAFYSLMDIHVSESIYARDEVSISNTLKVGGIELRPIMCHRPRQVVETKARIGLYEVNRQMYEWADRTVDHLRFMRDMFSEPVNFSDIISIFSIDREWVQDDSLLIAKAQSIGDVAPAASSVILISRDKRLANQMSESTTLTVFLLDPLVMIIAYPQKELNSGTTYTVDEVMDTGCLDKFLLPRKPTSVLVDTGALSAVSTKLVRYGRQMEVSSIHVEQWSKEPRTTVYYCENQGAFTSFDGTVKRFTSKVKRTHTPKFTGSAPLYSRHSLVRKVKKAKGPSSMNG